MRSIVRRALMNRGLQISRSESPESALWTALLRFERSSGNGEVETFVDFCLRHYGRGQAQLNQDLLVVFLTEMKTHGFFVEFGATDGCHLSNTYLLEQEYAWSGILAEPARVWHEKLLRNRSCIVDQRCVTAVSGQVVRFNETENPELSTIDSSTPADQHALERARGTRYDVDTISLNDLLEEYDAPHEFDYLSVDTEGSEAAILQSLDFTRFRPRIITIEHNYVRASRDQIKTVMTTNGYRQLWPELSRWDDWFVAE